ncbi:MAG: hypothetical protein LBV40_05955 [Methanomicrobiales archaeon]|jgi:hypothetical protein|nr:hypothetical protein [Methanomicrobiales archaeon]
MTPTTNKRTTEKEKNNGNICGETGFKKATENVALIPTVGPKNHGRCFGRREEFYRR